MKLWTIQHHDAYKLLIKNGILNIGEDNILDNCNYKFAYDWMAVELNKKDCRPKGLRYPIWAWYQWEGKRKKRDMRESGFSKRGDPMVQLEIEIPEEKVLLSDFDVYHMILNNGFIFPTVEEVEAFESLYKSQGIKYGDGKFDTLQEEKLEAVKRLIVDSWAGIFDLTKEDDNWLYGKNEDKSIQAVFWELREDQIIWTREFISK